MAPVAISKLIAIRTVVYVDGFNLYYWLKPTPFRWINIERLVLSALAYKSFHHQLVAIKYFTAEVSDTASDPGKHRRQFIYLRAQRAVTPKFRAYFGEFRR